MPWRALALWGPLGAYALAIFLVSGQSAPVGADVAGDKLLHGLAYAVFAALAYRALHGGARRFRWLGVVATLGVTAAYGAMDEVHQAFVPGRQPSAADWVADMIGGGVGTVLMVLYARFAGRSSPADDEKPAQ
jgi:VanZ family protein